MECHKQQFSVFKYLHVNSINSGVILKVGPIKDLPHMESVLQLRPVVLLLIVLSDISIEFRIKIPSNKGILRVQISSFFLPSQIQSYSTPSKDLVLS